MKRIASLLIACVAGTAPVLAARAASTSEAVMAEASGAVTTANEDQQRIIRALVDGAEDEKDLASLTVDYPLQDSIFPPEIIAPTFLWHDAAGEADRWLVDVAYAEGSEHFYALIRGVPPPQGEIDPEAISDTNEIYQPTSYQASAKSWKPSGDVWQTIKKHSRSRPATVTFLGYRSDDPSKVLSRGHVTLTTSADPVGAPIFYRDVPLMPPPGEKGVIMPLRKGALPLIKWRLKDISRRDSRVLLDDMPTCANCHSFSADGNTFGMDIDGPQGDKGSYAFTSTAKNMVITQDDVITWNSYEEKTHKTLGFMSQMRPDGRFAVTSLNEKIYVANFPDYMFGQVFYLTYGILAYYSAETGEMKALPGADDVEFVHVGPGWSPDGKWIVFSRAKATDPYPPGRPKATYANDPNEIPMQYDLYRMPFNEGRGGTPEPILGASNNGMSNSFPKVSPDGKWIVYVQCKNGLLMRPDSRLWIVPFEGGESRLMNANTSRMNSWHSFSPNGRWMVFSSKSNTPYTEMFLTHIDEKGNDSPAVLIENTTAANRAVNIPEFINRPFDELVSINVEAVQHFRHFDRAQDLAREGRLREAVEEYKKALETDTGESRIPIGLSKVLLYLGEYDEALKYTREALKAAPHNFEMHMNYGFLLARKGEVETGLQHMSAAIRINPRHPQLWYNRATLYLQQNDLDNALTDYNEALSLEPRYPDALTGRGMVLRSKGDLQGAMRDFEDSVDMKPNAPEPWYFMALIHKETGNLSAALDDLDAALEYVAPESPQGARIESLRQRVLAELGQGG